MLSVFHKKNAHAHYKQEINQLEKELNLFIQSKSEYTKHPFPYSKLDELINNINNIEVHSLRQTLLQTVQCDILSRLMQYEPKLFATYQCLDELINQDKLEAKEQPTYSSSNA